MSSQSATTLRHDNRLVELMEFIERGDDVKKSISVQMYPLSFKFPTIHCRNKRLKLCCNQYTLDPVGATDFVL